MTKLEIILAVALVLLLVYAVHVSRRLWLALGYIESRVQLINYIYSILQMKSQDAEEIWEEEGHDDDENNPRVQYANGLQMAVLGLLSTIEEDRDNHIVPPKHHLDRAVSLRDKSNPRG